MCPHCRQNAPLVFTGTIARCVACGQLRAPWSAGSVNYAGKPARVGGMVAKVAGWAVLIGGLIAALFLGMIAAWIFPATPAPWIVGGLVATLALLLGGPLVFGGKKLDQSGEKTETDTRMQALFALAANRGGALRAHEAGAALGVSADEADRLLTRMAKERSEDVTLDVTDAGEIVYGFPSVMQFPSSRARFAEPAVRFSTPERVRVAPPAGPVRVLDAEFEEIEEPASPARRRARA